MHRIASIADNSMVTSPKQFNYSLDFMLFHANHKSKERKGAERLIDFILYRLGSMEEFFIQAKMCFSCMFTNGPCIPKGACISNLERSSAC